MNVTLLLSQWWGSGIIHAKVWISDSRDVYIGSANNDWKSLTQVLKNFAKCFYRRHNLSFPFFLWSSINSNWYINYVCPLITGEGSWNLSCWLPKYSKKVEVYYNNLWKLASLDASAYTKTVWDYQWQISRKFPCWSHFVQSKERCRYGNWSMISQI